MLMNPKVAKLPNSSLVEALSVFPKGRGAMDNASNLGEGRKRSVMSLVFVCRKRFYVKAANPRYRLDMKKTSDNVTSVLPLPNFHVVQ